MSVSDRLPVAGQRPGASWLAAKRSARGLFGGARGSAPVPLFMTSPPPKRPWTAGLQGEGTQALSVPRRGTAGLCLAPRFLRARRASERERSAASSLQGTFAIFPAENCRAFQLTVVPAYGVAARSFRNRKARSCYQSESLACRGIVQLRSRAAVPTW